MNLRELEERLDWQENQYRREWQGAQSLGVVIVFVVLVMIMLWIGR